MIKAQMKSAKRKLTRSKQINVGLIKARLAK